VQNLLKFDVIVFIFAFFLGFEVHI
jgi:hypothetical protein